MTSKRTRRASTVRGASATEEITRRAYEIYLEKGGGNGHALDDWLQAEAEVLAARARPRGDPGRLGGDRVAPT
jgi:hypothetical protein